MPACPSPQCVSCRATVTPLPSSRRMTSPFALPRREWGSTSQRQFQLAMSCPRPVSALCSARARSGTVPMRAVKSSQVAAGGGVAPIACAQMPCGERHGCVRPSAR
eukprot:1912621-Prorocentrum_lima.AAC.1